MTVSARPRLWRLATVLPTVLTAVLGVGVAVTISAAPTSPVPDAPSARPVSVSNGDPITQLGWLNRVPGGLHVRGWAFDPDARSRAVTVYARIDGRAQPGIPATVARPDLAKIWPSAGPNHGFSYVVPVPEGRHTVCMRAANIGRGSRIEIGCRTLTFTYSPIGAVESLTPGRGSITVKGWAMDSDAWTTPLTMQVTVDGIPHSLTANLSRPDIARIHPHTGSTHGFAGTYAVTQGLHRVCVTAVNIGFGTNHTLDCRNVTLDERPLGVFDQATTSSGRLRLIGWAFDPDAPTSTATVSVRVDAGRAFTVHADRPRPGVGRVYPYAGPKHGFDISRTVKEGTHRICVTAVNVSYGRNRSLGCRTVVVTFTPTASLSVATATPTGLSVSGWAADPDTTRAIATHILLDGRTVAVLTANRRGGAHSGHNFATTLRTRSGKHVVCAVGINTLWGTHNSTASCRTVTLALRPIGAFESLTRASGSSNLVVTGYALDPDTTGALSIATTLDGVAVRALRAAATRTDVGARYPGLGSAHGISSTLTAGDGEHRVCLVAKNVGGGSDLRLGCRTINAVHPVAPGAPRGVTARAGYGSATVSWQAPASDGGAPWTGYTVVASPGGARAVVAAGVTSTTVLGLASSTTYTFAVTAGNVAGTSAAGVSSAVTTPYGPPPQTTPAPISTSRYIRNVRGSSAAELATMRAEGATDGRNNPSGHGYLVLLDIGGQDAYDNGVVLSATTRFVSYYDLLRDVRAYLDGYHSTQRTGAPVVVAVGTNNDMDVTRATGAAWATQLVNPLVSYVTRYPGMSVAGADDIEPGFRASYSATRNWLAGYLAATRAPFVFNGSADGCAWTITNRGCNNGWTMAGLHFLAAGAAPTRLLDLPQVYNTTMADQWKYISLTGVVNGLKRINFAGVLTEYTACSQAGGCGSIGGVSAWTRMWSDLQSDPRLKVASLPYATDLRIDR